MGKFKDVGDPAITLIEEMSEAIKVISKKLRFQGDWHEIPDGKGDTRWEELEYEMKDVMYQWERLKKQVIGEQPPIQLADWQCTEGTFHAANENCDCQDWKNLV